MPQPQGGVRVQQPAQKGAVPVFGVGLADDGKDVGSLLAELQLLKPGVGNQGFQLFIGHRLFPQ